MLSSKFVGPVQAKFIVAEVFVVQSPSILYPLAPDVALTASLAAVVPKVVLLASFLGVGRLVLDVSLP